MTQAPLLRLALAGVLALAGCATPPTAPPPPTVAHAAPHAAPKPLDWFHRQLALAQKARATHLPVGDAVGAQRAYYAVMVPVCGRVAASGPAQYRPRCRAIIQRASDAAAAATANPACDDDHDDSGDTQAQITACSD
jgi:hypothetical protein